MSSKEDLINAFNKSASDKEIGEKRTNDDIKEFQEQVRGLINTMVEWLEGTPVKIERSFRQKSRQATLQIKMQAWIMAFMFVSLLAYVCSQFGFQQYLSLILTATNVFFIGFLIRL